MSTQPKYHQFITNLLNIVNSVSNTQIKEIIGDSVNNHRTVSVIQTVRFLDQIGESDLAAGLEDTFNLLRDDLKQARLARGTTRRDAFDIYEFADLYDDLLLQRNNTSLRRAVAQLVA
jgi:hypothetical protein